MRACIVIFCLCFNGVIVKAQKDFKSLVPITGKTFRDFIPKGYDTLSAGQSVAIGDLNKDGLEDIVLVLKNIEQEDKYHQSVEDRPLIILFKDGNYYRLATIAINVILCKECGGIMGDPFVGVFIKNNVLTISHYGGSAWRWSIDMKFRYQNDGFYLIGRTNNSFWINANCNENTDVEDGARTYDDINYITGDRIRKKTSEDCKVLLNKKDKIKVRPLIKMSDSSIEE